MKGIDIIEAMNRIDESLIIGAKQHKRSAPTWMRLVAMAACFCCIVAIGAFSIQSILTPATEEVSPGALTSTPEETISIPPTLEPTEAPNVVLNSNQYDLELSVPEEYVDNFRVDIPFSYESPSSDYLYIDSAVFSFYMAFSEEDQMDGFLWLIEATEKTAFSQAAYEEGLSLNYLMNRSILGSDETYIYSLYHPGIPHADCFDSANLEEVQTYYDHAMDGLSILEQFVADNSLESDGSWKALYTEKTLQPVADMLQELGGNTPENEEYTILTGVAGGTGLTADLYLPLRYKNSIDIATPCSFIWNESGVDLEYDYDNAVFSFYDRNQEAYGYDGLVWIITEDPIESKDNVLEHDSTYGSNSFIFNHHILGMNEHKIYSITTISPEYADSRRYSIESKSAIESYYQHMLDGITILEDFVEINNLEVPDGIVDWREWYENNALSIVKEQMESTPESIKIAVHHDTEFTMLANLVNSYNAAQDEYQVELLDMREYVPEENSKLLEGVKGWKSVLDSNDDIDMISVVPGWASVLGKTGYLADLNEYIDTADILPSLWNATKTGDKNYCLPYQFYVNAFYGKTEHVGSATDLRVDDFLSLADPGIPLFPELTASDYTFDLQNHLTTNYIDLDQGACNFNSEDFIKLLDYANTLPQTETSLSTDWYKYIRYDEALFLSRSIWDFYDVNENETTYIDAPLTLTGWPNENGGSFSVTGGFALTKEGADNEGAIAFLEYILSDAGQAESMEFDFPITISGMDNMCNSILSDPETEYTLNHSTTETIDGITYQYEPITKEKLEEYQDWLNGIDTFVIWSDEITTIIKEESASMLGGSQTAEEAANRIQARVTEYLDELFN